MKHQPFTFCRCGSQRTEIVTGWPQATVDDQHIRMFTPLAQNADEIIQAIADGIAAR
ncbi:hypothetical protein D3C85_1889590 [compost metagenome]